jgi:hypothetical protein
MGTRYLELLRSQRSFRSSPFARSPIGSYLQKQAQPKAPRHKVTTFELQAKHFRAIDGHSPSHLRNFIIEYLRNRFGRKYPFQTYPAGQSVPGVHA